ncbi:MAG: rhodanese-like domain-containing protein [Gammaproteobacteria bacterium]|nr:rhodanese-like domain-containing protein [Gammaproteobacteria bacterium]
MWRSRIAQLTGVCSILATTSVYAWTNVTSEEAFQCATEQDDCYILDVRTPDEWRWVGHPGTNKAGVGEELEDKVANISWLVQWRNELVKNWFFLRDVETAFGIPGDDDELTLITMCRSGSRSKAAADALEAAGYTKVFNMTHGFEGARDASGYRTVNGWKVEGFPYVDNAVGAY